MRDATIINELKILHAKLQVLRNYVQTVSTGATLFEETLKNLLMEKGIFTEIEFTEAMGKEIKKLQEAEAKAEEEEKKKLVTPSAEQTAQINEQKKSTDKSVSKEKSDTQKKEDSTKVVDEKSTK